jgi:hypothetical protein
LHLIFVLAKKYGKDPRVRNRILGFFGLMIRCLETALKSVIYSLLMGLGFGCLVSKQRGYWRTFDDFGGF